MSTAIIPRDPTTPSPRVLEIDGPRFRHLRRSERPYCLSTDNQPCLPVSDLSVFETELDPRLCEDFGEAHWEIHQHNDGRIEIHACRPTDDEIIEGDFHGALGSVIKLTSPTRWALRNGLRLARRLLRADPKQGVVITARELIGIITVQGVIPVVYYTHIEGP
jgi:hypothetical protein